MSEEVKEVSTPASVETNAAPATTSTDGVTPLKTETTEGQDTGAEGTAPAYNPNYKFSVMDKEHEIDEWLRPVIKDAEMEKKVKDLYTKAYGLEFTKSKNTELEKELGDTTGRYQELYANVADAMESKNQGDLDSFFKKVGLSNDQIYDWILAKINRQNLPPEQRKVYEDLEAKSRAERDWEKQFSVLNTQYQTMAEKNREMEVDFMLAKPEIASVVEQYDSQNGKGAFKRFVGEIGVYNFHVTGQDMPAEAVISEVMKRIGGAYSSRPAQSAPTASAADKPLPVIPNISGRNVSPAKKSPRSINDLKKLAEEAMT